MRAYGSKRTYGGCRTYRKAGHRKIQIGVIVKNRKRWRKSAEIKEEV